MAGHVRIQDSISMKEPLTRHVEDEEMGEGNSNGQNGIHLTSPNLQVPMSASSERRRSSLRRRMSGTSHASTRVLADAEETVIQLWDRFTRKGKGNIGVLTSLRAIALSSWLNAFLVFVPLAWISHFLHWPDRVTFTLSWLAIIPLERLVEWGGEEMAYYLGKDLGDLLIVTLHNSVEATLAIILLTRCELSLLKSTIVGVVILHLLLVPGMAFLTGGARVLHQDLHPHLTELNHSLLALGVLSLTLPAAFFSAINASVNPAGSGTAEADTTVVSDFLRDEFLKMSRGIAICLLFIYICSRIYLHNPPGENIPLHLLPHAPEALKEHEHHLQEGDPVVNQYICVAMLAVCMGLIATTAEWLVKALEFANHDNSIRIEFFGLILLPLVSYGADGTLALGYHVRSLLRHYFRQPSPPNTLAKGRAIDLSIQFTLFWMPFLVLLGWWTGKPMTLLFDFFEVVVVVGACFIVNYVTADSKTNWAEGATMISFYTMIALCSWFYPGQPAVLVMSECGSVAESLAAESLSH